MHVFKFKVLQFRQCNVKDKVSSVLLLARLTNIDSVKYYLI